MSSEAEGKSGLELLAWETSKHDSFLSLLITEMNDDEVMFGAEVAIRQHERKVKRLSGKQTGP